MAIPILQRFGNSGIGGCCLVLAFLAATSVARGQSPATSRPSDFLSSPNPYTRGTWTATGYGGFAVQPGGGYREQIGFGTIGLGYYFKDNMSLNAELTGVSFTQPGVNATAGGGDLLLRGHLYNGRNWSLFTDLRWG